MRPVFILSIILLLVGCKQRDERVLMVDEQGSFAIGGTVLVDSLGHTYHGDHAYVFYQKPVGARKYPLVFAHGVGQFSKTWETTPDGREGFQNIFLRCGFSVYLVDQPRRGNAGRGTESVTISPAFDEEVWFNRFRVGIWPDYFEGVQFKRDKETLDQYFRQMTPTIGTTDFEVYSDAYAALFDKIGPGVFITHSQGGPVGWNTLLKTRNIKAIASYEPGGAVPFPQNIRDCNRGQDYWEMCSRIYRLQNSRICWHSRNGSRRFLSYRSLSILLNMKKARNLSWL